MKKHVFSGRLMLAIEVTKGRDARWLVFGCNWPGHSTSEQGICERYDGVSCAFGARRLQQSGCLCEAGASAFRRTSWGPAEAGGVSVPPCARKRGAAFAEPRSEPIFKQLQG